jgi:RimJ/RimL family protein N-acetyltransferase
MNLRQAARPLTDLELLEVQAEMAMDGHRRLAGICGVILAAARDGQAIFVGSEVPKLLVPALTAAAASPLPSTPDHEPPALAACRAMLEPHCRVLSLNAGPSYLFDPDIRIEMGASIARSDAPQDERLRLLNPGNWERDEWDDLLDGVLGPWAIAVVDERIVSICHTPQAMTDRAAECGVWTDPDYRGRGYAAAVTATWADILRPSGRFLFYSTDAENLSSQRVAARLHLCPIGWTWSLTDAGHEQRLDRHPLSRRLS